MANGWLCWERNVARARADGMSELHVPKRILPVPQMPLLGSGKADYPAVHALVEAALPRGERGVP